MGMPRHTSPKIVFLEATFPSQISSFKKSNKLVHSVHRYSLSKNPAAWLDKSILAHNLWTSIFSIMKLYQKSRRLLFFIAGYFQQKVMIKVYENSEKIQLWTHFGFISAHFPENKLFSRKSTSLTFSLSFISILVQNFRKRLKNKLREKFVRNIRKDQQTIMNSQDPHPPAFQRYNKICLYRKIGSVMSYKKDLLTTCTWSKNMEAT